MSTTSDQAPAGGWDAAVDELALLADSDAQACLRRAQVLLPLAQRLDATDARMRLGYHRAVAHHALGQDLPALEDAHRCEQLAVELDTLEWQSRALALQGLVHHDLGHVEDAVHLLNRAAQLRRDADDQAGTADVLTMLGTVYTAMPHFAPQAACVLHEARRLWLAADDPDRASIALSQLARTFVESGRRMQQDNPRGAAASGRQALTLAMQAVDEADSAGLSRTGIEARFTVAAAHELAGKPAAATAVLDAAEQMLNRFPAGGQQLTLHRARARLLLSMGRADEAVAEAATGMALSEALGRPGERVELLRVLALAHEACGDLRSALTAMHELHRLTVTLSDTVAERQAVLLGARLEIEQAERQVEAERRRALALAEHNARLTHEASHDALTGLPNRRELDRTLARRDPRCVALVDVDHFKRVNDTFSHRVGDQVLARVAATLLATVSDDGLVARYGGEEFALILADDEAAAAATCERARAAIAALTWPAPMGDERVTVSLGIASSHQHAEVAALLAAADAALYSAKRAGRNRVVLAGPTASTVPTLPSPRATNSSRDALVAGRG